MLYFLPDVLKKLINLKSAKFTATVLAINITGYASAATPVAGWLEGVYVDGIKNRIIGKLDTGALTSSIHGRDARVIKHGDEEWVRFEFLWEKDDKLVGPYTIEAPLVRKVLIKDHEDDSRERYVVNMNFALSGECYTAEFSVADRSRFNYPVLLGRRFQAGEVIVDSSKTFTDLTVPTGKSPCKEVEDHKIEQRVKLDKVQHKKELEKLEEANEKDAD